MIVVVCDQTGDRAEADTPDNARLAAVTLCADAYQGHSWQGFDPTASFYVNDRPVRVRVSERELWRKP